MIQDVKATVAALTGLRAPGARLKQAAEGGWGIFVAKNRYRKPLAILNETQVKAFYSAEWIFKSEDGSFVLSPTGRSWLARQLGGADGFRRQHQMTKREAVKTPNGITLELERDLSESPLAWLRSRKDKAGRSHISDEQFRAGERLRADFTRAQMNPKVTATWSAGTASGGRKRHGARANAAMEMSDTALAAREKFYRALDTTGPELAGILVEVCCFLHGIEQAEKTLSFPRRSGKLVLQLALTALARHYGYINTPNQYARMDHWGGEGYRPEIG